jgi:hypothetical protein
MTATVSKKYDHSIFRIEEKSKKEANMKEDVSRISSSKTEG